MTESASSAPIAGVPEQATISGTTLTNSGNVALTDVSIAFQLIVIPYDRLAMPREVSPITPSLSWSIDGGAWHPVHLQWHWEPQPPPSLSWWLTDEERLPALAPHTRHSVRLRMSFRQGTRPGWYDADVYFGATCTPSVSDQVSFSYDPAVRQDELRRYATRTQAPASPRGSLPPSPPPSGSPEPPLGLDRAESPETRLAAAPAEDRSRGPWLAGAAAAMMLLAGFVAAKAVRARRLLP
ncbi:hypothetical protein QEZ54_25315 [Catellatospora sp. KI3]|uniref:hypothetical protein n=1 Tax=Catellatospora sp. KI3 TaxID=3041620 RepID=UPI002482A128|nr:hypothetical protein [Catellatospora sp. KI3]MDI1464295.1 hypothetical protein [Catellatospora sp. KI3]